MVAWQRTNITQREERGLGPISFKRLLIAGGILAMSTMGLSRTVGFFGGCVSGVLLAALALIFSHPKDGMALWAFMARTTRGLATIAAIRGEQGTWQWVGKILQVSPEQGLLRADEIYDAEYRDQVEDPLPLVDEQWTLLGHIEDVNDRGFRVIADPFANFNRRRLDAPASQAGGSD